MLTNYNLSSTLPYNHYKGIHQNGKRCIRVSLQEEADKSTDTEVFRCKCADCCSGRRLLDQTLNTSEKKYNIVLKKYLGPDIGRNDPIFL